MRKALLIVAAVAIAIGTLAVFGGFNQSTKACFHEHCFYVTVADTDIKRARGLMGRGHLGEQEGMLFVFDQPGWYPFWMKNMLIPLDIIWLDADGQVVFIAHDAQPCHSECVSIDPGVEAAYVLETNGGVARRIGLDVGNVVDILY